MRAADLQPDFHADSAGLERSIVGRVRFIAVAIKTIGVDESRQREAAFG
jgi:hypothetical protein